MSDNSNRVSLSGIAASTVERVRPASGVAGISSSGLGADAPTNSGVDRGAIGGPRGNRILPADYPLDQLDRKAARGTYLDILV